MAKSPFNIKSGGGTFKKLVLCLLLLAVLAFVVKYPTDAAGAVHTAKDSGTGALDGLVQFFRSLGKS